MVHLLKWPVIESQCRQQPFYVSDGYLTVWWPWDRSCFSVSRSHLWCICSDLSFWMIAGWTGRGSGGWCPRWSFPWSTCGLAMEYLLRCFKSGVFHSIPCGHFYRRDGEHTWIYNSIFWIQFAKLIISVIYFLLNYASFPESIIV